MYVKFDFFKKNNFPKNNFRYSQNFCGAKSRKFLKKLAEEPNLKCTNITFDDLVDAYKELGYDIVYKRGSHAIVPLNNEINITLVIPHGRNHISRTDLKRLRYVIDGDFEKASKI